MEIYQDLLEYSKENKRGLTFYVKGQTITGIVIEIIEDKAVLARSQMFDQIIIKLDSLDAIAIT